MVACAHRIHTMFAIRRENHAVENVVLHAFSYKLLAIQIGRLQNSLARTRAQV
jgi:hypothetical protein